MYVHVQQEAGVQQELRSSGIPQKFWCTSGAPVTPCSGVQKEFKFYTTGAQQFLKQDIRSMYNTCTTDVQQELRSSEILQKFRLYSRSSGICTTIAQVHGRSSEVCKKKSSGARQKLRNTTGVQVYNTSSDVQQKLRNTTEVQVYNRSSGVLQKIRCTTRAQE